MAAVLLRILRKKLEKFISNPSDLSWDISSGTVHAPALALNLDFVNTLLPASICVEALVIKDVHVKFSVTQIAKEPVIVSIGVIEILLMELAEPRAQPPSKKKKKEVKESKPKKKSSFSSIAAAFIDGLRLSVQSIIVRLSVLPLQPSQPAIIFEASGFSLSGANESYQPIGNRVYSVLSQDRSSMLSFKVGGISSVAIRALLPVVCGEPPEIQSTVCVQVTKLSELALRLMLQRDASFFDLKSLRVDVSLKDAIIILSGSQLTLLRHLLLCVSSVLGRKKLYSGDEQLESAKAEDEDIEDLGEVTKELEATLEAASLDSVIMDSDGILDMKNRFEFSLGKLHLEVVDDADELGYIALALNVNLQRAISPKGALLKESSLDAKVGFFTIKERPASGSLKLAQHLSIFKPVSSDAAAASVLLTFKMAQVGPESPTEIFAKLNPFQIVFDYVAVQRLLLLVTQNVDFPSTIKSSAEDPRAQLARENREKAAASAAGSSTQEVSKTLFGTILIESISVVFPLYSPHNVSGEGSCDEWIVRVGRTELTLTPLYSPPEKHSKFLQFHDGFPTLSSDRFLEQLLPVDPDFSALFGCISIDLMHHRHLDVDIVKIEPITIFKSAFPQVSDGTTTQQLVISGSTLQANFGSVHIEALSALSLHMKHDQAQVKTLKPVKSSGSADSKQVPNNARQSKPTSLSTISLQFKLLAVTFTHPLCRAPVLSLELNNLVLARQTFLREHWAQLPTIISTLLASLGSLSLNMCSLGVSAAPSKDASVHAHPAFSLRLESASDGSSLILSKLNGAFIAIDLKVIRMLSKIWKAPSLRLKATAPQFAAAGSSKESAAKKPKKSGLAGLHFLSDVSSTVIRVGQGDAVSEFSATGILFRNRGHHLSNWPGSFNAGCPSSWIMASNVAAADSASSSSSAVKSDFSAAIIDELKALEMSLGPSAAASIAKARERLLARVAEADSSSSTRQNGGVDWSWGGDNVQALHAQADRLVSINRCIRFYIESVFASESSHGARIVRMRELRAQSLAKLGSGQASKVGNGDDSTWTIQGKHSLLLNPVYFLSFSKLFSNLFSPCFAGMRNAFLMFLEDEYLFLFIFPVAFSLTPFTFPFQVV
jgi:hypothetical protein